MIIIRNTRDFTEPIYIIITMWLILIVTKLFHIKPTVVLPHGILQKFKEQLWISFTIGLIELYDLYDGKNSSVIS